MGLAFRSIPFFSSEKRRRILCLTFRTDGWTVFFSLYFAKAYLFRQLRGTIYCCHFVILLYSFFYSQVFFPYNIYCCCCFCSLSFIWSLYVPVYNFVRFPFFCTFSIIIMNGFTYSSGGLTEANRKEKIPAQKKFGMANTYEKKSFNIVKKKKEIIKMIMTF